MAWSDPVDLYCERSGAALLAEPINALTNLAFLVAAGVAFWQWHRRGGKDFPVLGLILILTLIGMGSLLFHIFATRAAMLADVIPIALFVFGYFFLVLRRFLRLELVPALVILAAFIALSQSLPFFVSPDALNGSFEYLLPLAALIVLGFFTPGRMRRQGLLAAAALFAVSLAFRTIDNTVCASIPLGTHFIWHLLNAGVLYLLIGTAMRPALGRRPAIAL